MLFFSDPTAQTVGLDISEHVFRLIEIRRNPFLRRGLRLHCYAEERIPDGLIVAGEFKKPDQIVKHLQSLMKKAFGRMTMRGAIVSLPETRTFIKVISVTKPASDRDIGKEVMAEAELHIPMPISDLYLDWQAMPGVAKLPVGKPMTVTIAAAPKSIVDSYSTVLEATGFVPVAYEIEAQAIVRSVIPAAEDGLKAFGIIDFGATRSSFIVYDKGTIQFTVSVPLSGDVVTRRISEALEVGLPEAERTKRQCGVDANKCGTTLWSIMEPFLREMSAHVLDAVSFYRDHFPDGRMLDEIILCGGGANMERLDELLADLTKIPVRKANPWINIDATRTPLPLEIILSSTTTIGLALRQRVPAVLANRKL